MSDENGNDYLKAPNADNEQLAQELAARIADSREQDRQAALDRLGEIADETRALATDLLETCRTIGQCDGMMSLTAAVPLLFGVAGTCHFAEQRAKGQI